MLKFWVCTSRYSIKRCIGWFGGQNNYFVLELYSFHGSQACLLASGHQYFFSLPTFQPFQTLLACLKCYQGPLLDRYLLWAFPLPRTSPSTSQLLKIDICLYSPSLGEASLIPQVLVMKTRLVSIHTQDFPYQGLELYIVKISTLDIKNYREMAIKSPRLGGLWPECESLLSYCTQLLNASNFSFIKWE